MQGTLTIMLWIFMIHRKLEADPYVCELHQVVSTSAVSMRSVEQRNSRIGAAVHKNVDLHISRRNVSTTVTCFSAPVLQMVISSLPKIPRQQGELL